MPRNPSCLLLLLLWLSASTRGFAQHEADNWYFGDRAGLSFRDRAPVPLTDGQLTTPYACAVASAPTTGQLLFYSNGMQVWNQAHQLMPHGDSLRGYYGANQGALIVPVPGDAHRYYLFTLWQQTQPPAPTQFGGGVSQLFYSLIDLRLGGGRGDVVAASKNTPLAGRLTEKLTAVRHANGRDYWVLVHRWASNEFLVYAVTAEGIEVASSQAIGPTHPALLADTAQAKGTAGYLQASPDGRRLACAVAFGTEPFSLLNFDAATGTFSNPLNLGLLRDAYGVCFSPDNTKLYVEDHTELPGRAGNAVLSQYDLAAGDAAAVAASGRSIVAGNPATNIRANQGFGGYYALQNGPDGRIYGASGYQPADKPLDYQRRTMFVIGRPNARGFGAAVHYQSFAFEDQVHVAGGLPNFMQHSFNGLEPSPSVDLDCEPGPVTLFPNPSADAFRGQVLGNCPQPYTLRIYNAIGQQVARYEGRETTSQVPISVASLAAGIYLVELRFAHHVAHEKLINY